MNDVCNMRTGVVLDGRAYEIHELQYGCYLKGSQQWEWFANADSQDVASIAVKRYRENRAVIQETTV